MATIDKAETSRWKSGSLGSCYLLPTSPNQVLNMCFQRQARRVYEILRLQHTNENDDAEFTKYRLAIKSRINQPMMVRLS